MVDELVREVQELEERIAFARQQYDEATGLARVVIEEGLRGLNRKLVDARLALTEARRREEREDAYRSPMGQLLYAVADAFQFDYLDSDDLPDVIHQVRKNLVSRGLAVTVERVE